MKQKFHVITIKRSKKVSILYVVVALNEETLSRGWLSSEKLVALKRDNIHLDVWVEEELKVSSLSNNTVTLYLGVVKIMKRHPLSKRKLRTVTSEHMQEFMDYLSFGGTAPDGTEAKPLSIDRIHSFSAVLQRAFRYAVFPKQYISFNPMQYVVIRRPTQEVDLFATEDEDFSQEKTITHQQYNEIVAYLTNKKSSSLMAVQIAYYAGLRIGEVTGLSWDDINLEEQYLTVRRSLSRNNTRHKLELGPTKRKKVRIVDFGDTLAEILRKAKKEQHKQRFQYGQLYQRNYYKEVREKNRVYYELYSLDGTQEVPEDYTEISLVCVRQDGMYLGREALDWMCRSIRKHLKGFENFHFHSLRHTYTSNLLENGAPPKDVQELLGHSAVSTTMNIYAHATREAKKNSARLLDKVVGND